MLSKSQVDKLGERLRKGTPADGDEELLEEFLQRHTLALTEVRETISGISDPVVALTAETERVKTRGTLVEKLVREKSRLSSVQDVAGVRLVLPATWKHFLTRPSSSRQDQDTVVDLLVKVFQGARIIDRRVAPSQGYRAVHIIVPTSAGVNAEIQVRTSLQHAWAEAFERLADFAGRNVRYGGDISLDEAFGGPDARQLVELLHTVSANLDTLEQKESHIASFIAAAGVGAPEPDRAESEIAVLQDTLREPIQGFQSLFEGYLATLNMVSSKLGNLR